MTERTGPWGNFITLEGGEGCGKSTQVALLGQALQAAAVPHVLTREPGGTAGIEQIRQLLVTGEPDRWSPMAELLLFQAARVEHIERIIRPALEAGQLVLCDRYIDSTRVYQGIVKGQGVEMVDAIHTQTTRTPHRRGLWPQLTLLLDIDPEIGLKRASNRAGSEGRFEAESLAFHQALRAAYLRLAAADERRFVVIDASQPVAAVHRDILDALHEAFALQLLAVAV